MCSPMQSASHKLEPESKVSTPPISNPSKLNIPTVQQTTATTPKMAIIRPTREATTIRLPGELSPPSSHQLRARYFLRLGITQTKQKKIAPLKLTRPPARPKPVTLQIPLKQKDEQLPASRSRAVSFDDSVSVRPIPMRKEYSQRIRKELWGDRNEMVYSINRNTIEFAAENWDWRQACEELVPCENGDLIHPVHLIQQRCTVQRQFFRHMMSNQAAH